MKKEILKETREPGKSRKKKGQPKGWRNGFLEGLTGKDFTAAGLFFFSLLVPAVRPAIRRIRLLD